MISTSVNSHVSRDLSACGAALELCQNLQRFHSTVRDRTGIVADAWSIDINSLRQVPLSETNEDAVKFILQRMKDINNNPELLDLVSDYFDTVRRTSEFVPALAESLERARDSQGIIQIALQKFDGEQRLSVDGLLELNKFKELGNPFTVEFSRKIQGTAEQQKLMLEKLQSKKTKLDNEFKSQEVGRKVSNLLYVCTYAAVLIWSVAAEAVAAPPAVTAPAVGASMLLGPLRKGVNSIWKNHKKKVEGEREIVRMMQIAVEDFGGIQARVGNLETEIKALLQNADSAVRGENEAVDPAVHEAKMKMRVFMRTIDELGEHVNNFSRDIRRARVAITQDYQISQQ
ncbi:hypothetical protein NMG60_11026153 [Bertholletia excelsa]